MTAETVMTMTYQAMKIALAMAGPLLVITLIVGLVISIFQAATQINEMTLSFIPKLLAMCGVLVLLG
ncbi:flagellar biosynthetic protein FliQ, partial [Achromobacter xylosoxidans]|nr:flagellar biosynthetic protein FliQ [Achromobacter xylosoxidans]